MTYSRSRTQNKQKSQRRNKLKLLLIINGLLVTIIIIAAAILWNGQKDRVAEDKHPGTSEIQSKPTPDHSTQALPSSEPSVEPPSAQPLPEVVESNSPETTGDTINLALVGDILPAARVLELMEKNGYDYPYREAKSILEAADITAGNLESSITTRGTAAEDKQYLFRAPPETLPAIKEAGFDYLSLANNHTMDYGWEGLSDTMDFLDDIGLQHSGSGNDDSEAFTPAYIESKGITVAFVSVTRVVPDVSWKADRNKAGLAEAYSPDRAVAAIKAAKENADVVVVMAHWGKERLDTPVDHQIDLAHRFIDAGADLVAGSHPHVLQGFESYKGKWIAYSLGNFIFSTSAPSNTANTPNTSETGVLNAQCDKEGVCSLKFQPMFATSSQPALMDEVKGKALLKRLSTLSYGAAVKEDGSIVAIP